MSRSRPELLELENPSLTLWHPRGACSETDNSFRISSLAFISDSSYLKGMKAIMTGNRIEAQALLQSAYILQGNHLAPALLSSSLVGESAAVSETYIAFSRLDQRMLEPAALYFLALAGQCHIAGERGLALDYLELGLSFLSEGREHIVNSNLSRRVGEIYYYNGQSELAEPWLWQAASGGYSPLILLSRILSQQERYEEAISIYERALSYYPENVELVKGGAQAAIAVGKFPQARSFLEEISEPENLGIQGLLLLARVCQEMDDLPCARINYHRVLQIDASNPDAMHALQKLRK